MDLTDLARIASTAAGFICFILIAVWAFGKSAKPRFDEAAMQPIADEDSPASWLKE